MSVHSSTERPILCITLGDAAGIGPELVAKIAADGFLQQECRPIILGDRRVLEQGMKIAGVAFPFQIISDPAQADFSKGIQLIDTKDLDPAGIKLGEVSPVSGKITGDTLVKAIEYCKQGLVDGMVFAPLNKTALKKGGYDHESEHRILALHFGVTKPSGEINYLDGLMTSRVTSHIPISAVSANLTKKNILDAIDLMNDTARMSGLAKPRLGISALNPHSGENGTCGREEIDVIAPAIQEARARGIDAIGPISADVVFLKAFKGEYDAVVTMYHDQGQIALKLKGFDRGVTVGGGMPSPVTTPAHGTAFDITGKNLADTGATKSAVSLCAKMARHGKRG